MNELFQPESENDRHLRIKAGLDDVLAGRIIPHSEIKAWAKSLEDAARALLDRTDH
jgi:predicted transcriptional regulator